MWLKRIQPSTWIVCPVPLQWAWPEKHGVTQPRFWSLYFYPGDVWDPNCTITDPVTIPTSSIFQTVPQVSLHYSVLCQLFFVRGFVYFTHYSLLQTGKQRHKSRKGTEVQRLQLFSPALSPWHHPWAKEHQLKFSPQMTYRFSSSPAYSFSSPPCPSKNTFSVFEERWVEEFYILCKALSPTSGYQIRERALQSPGSLGICPFYRK